MSSSNQRMHTKAARQSPTWRYPPVAVAGPLPPVAGVMGKPGSGAAGRAGMGDASGGTTMGAERGMGGGTGKSASLMLSVSSDRAGAERCEGGPISPCATTQRGKESDWWEGSKEGNSPGAYAGRGTQGAWACPPTAMLHTAATAMRAPLPTTLPGLA